MEKTLEDFKQKTAEKYNYDNFSELIKGCVECATLEEYIQEACENYIEYRYVQMRKELIEEGYRQGKTFQKLQDEFDFKFRLQEEFERGIKQGLETANKEAADGEFAKGYDAGIKESKFNEKETYKEAWNASRLNTIITIDNMLGDVIKLSEIKKELLKGLKK